MVPSQERRKPFASDERQNQNHRSSSGPEAYPAVPVGGGSARVEPFVAVSLLQGHGPLPRWPRAPPCNYHRGLLDPHRADGVLPSCARWRSGWADWPGLVVELFDGVDFHPEIKDGRRPRARSGGRAKRRGVASSGRPRRPRGVHRCATPHRPSAGEHELVVAAPPAQTSGYRLLYLDGGRRSSTRGNGNRGAASPRRRVALTAAGASDW